MEEIDTILEDILANQASASLLLNEKLLNEPLILDNKLAQLCLKLPRSQFNVDDIYIVWLKYENETQVESIGNIKIKIFYTNNELIDFICKIQTTNIFLIIDQYLVENILSLLDDFSQILFIYFLTNENIPDDHLFINCKRSIRKISNNKSKLFRSIEEDIDTYTKDYISTSIFDLNENEENLSFFWYHLLINTLFDSSISQQTSNKDFIKHCREQCSLDNLEEQNLITEFENNYSFIYRRLNKALRTRDIDLIFKLRFFIIDFQNQLEQYYMIESFEVTYRAQQVSSLEFDKLKNSIGKYISINTYLSTTVVKNVAANPSSILFVIKTGNVIYRKKYAGPKSYAPDEFEVIFPIGWIFFINSMSMEDNQWNFELILSDNDNYEKLFHYFLNDYVMELPPVVQFADLLISTGEYERAEQYLQILIKDLEISNAIKGYIYGYMGDISTEKCRVLSWYENALDLIPTENMYSVKIYLAIGLLHFDNQKYDNALEYFHKAREVILNMKQYFLRNNVIAQLNYKYSCIYKLKNNLEEALRLNEENDLSDEDRRIYHRLIGLYFKKYKDFSNALYHFQSLLNNPPCYYDLLLTYTDIVDTYNEMESQDFLFYANKCFEIYFKLSTIQQSSLLTSKICKIHYQIGNLYKTKGDKTIALTYYQNAEQILNEYRGGKELTVLYRIIGSSYESLQYYNQALFCFKKAITNISNDYNKSGYYYSLIADVYYKKKDYLMSISIYKISLTFLHNSSSINYQYLASCYQGVASLYEVINNYKYAFIYSKQAIEYYLLCQPIKYDSVIALYNFSAVVLWKSKPWNVQEPLEYLLLAIDFTRYNLKNNSLYSNLGLFYILNQMYDKALLSYNKSSSSDENYEKIWLIYMLIGDLDKAYDTVIKSIENQFNEKTLNVDHISKSYMNIGMIYYAFGRYQLALKCYKTSFYFLKAFQNDKTHGNIGNIYNSIGLIYYKYGNFVDALRYCLKARDILSLDKNQDFLPINPYISLGLIECKLENYSNSLNYFGRAWELIYNNNHYKNLAYKILYNHIGYVYYKLNQTELAMKFYLKSLSLYNDYNQHPDLAQIHKNIGLIYEQNPETYSLALSSYKHALESVPDKEHSDYILYKSMIITLKLKIKKQRRKKRFCSQRTCSLL